MNWTNLWLHLFGTTSWLGLNLGFWVATGLVLLLLFFRQFKRYRAILSGGIGGGPALRIGD